MFGLLSPLKTEGAGQVDLQEPATEGYEEVDIPESFTMKDNPSYTTVMQSSM